MKKLLFGLIATVMFGFVGNAQSNSKNEYDYVGKTHNEILNEFLKDYDKNLSIQEICTKIQSIANKNQTYLSLKEPKIDYRFIENSKDDFTNKFKNVINNTTASSTAKNEMQSLIDYMYTLAFSSSKPEYKDFYNYVLNFESKIISNSSLSASDKKLILSGTSTARFSAFLWSQKIQQTEVNSRRPWWAWAIVGVADVAGAFGGGVANVGTAAAASGGAYTMTDPDKK
jgi:hypothetical protein